ncbi:MAG: Hpt domain-containing protein [Provencibacterium sp.]|jgi:HPt (histidine-containing phosphotransfer) domain-containing protein|nr:Hpt domain-containing protein [Provencibacterium sp.]
MSLKECYAALGGDYEDVTHRLPSEKMVRKFVFKFLNDPSYALLESSLEAKNYEEAFRAAHTIKGVCQNLSFSRLFASSNALTEALRGGWTPEAEGLVQQVTADYQATVSAIRALQEEEGEG